jgi:electron-transferring-flavoprotein dehydrogenase
LGVDILPGIAGDKIIYNDDGSVGGVITGDFGIAKDGSKRSNY